MPEEVNLENIAQHCAANGADCAVKLEGNGYLCLLGKDCNHFCKYNGPDFNIRTEEGRKTLKYYLCLFERYSKS